MDSMDDLNSQAGARRIISAHEYVRDYRSGGDSGLVTCGCLTGRASITAGWHCLNALSECAVPLLAVLGRQRDQEKGFEAVSWDCHGSSTACPRAAKQWHIPVTLMGQAMPPSLPNDLVNPTAARELRFQFPSDPPLGSTALFVVILHY